MTVIYNVSRNKYSVGLENLRNLGSTHAPFILSYMTEKPGFILTTRLSPPCLQNEPEDSAVANFSTFAILAPFAPR